MTAPVPHCQQTIHEALAQKLESIGIWEGFLHAPLITGAERDLMVAALRGGAIAELETALTMCRDTNRVLRETLRVVRESVIEECAKLIESGAGMADLIDQEDLDQQAKYIRALSQAPVTDAVPSVNLNWLVDWVHLYATEGHSWISRGTTDKLVRLAVRAPTQADADYLKTGMLSDLPEVSHD